MSAKAMDYEGITRCCWIVRKGYSHAFLLTCGWTRATAGEDKGADWVQKTLGWRVQIVRRPPKPASEEVLMAWAKQWAKEGVTVDWQELLPPRGFQVLPRRWVVERTFAWISHNRRMSKDYERLAQTSEAFIYVAMTRLMVRRLARAR